MGVEIKVKKAGPVKTERNINLKKIISTAGPLFGLIILCIVLAIMSPYFLEMTNLMNIARQSAINSLIAVGMLLAILTAGIDLSVGSILALSTVIMGLLVINMGLNPFLGIIVCLAIGALLGFFNGIMLTKLHLPHPFISTLGMMNIARGLSLIVTKASPVSGFPPSIQYLGAAFIGPVPVSFILVIIIYVIYHFFLTKTPTGRYIYAVGGNPEAARLSGINVEKVLVIVYTLSGLMAAMGGLVLAGRVNAAYPLAGLGYELDAIAAVIIGGASFMGGVGTVWGTLIGAMIMAVLRNGLNLLGVTAEWQTVAIGTVIIAAVYIDVVRRRAQAKSQVTE
ncbi:MAG: ribose transport system permease protein [Thermoanaerobacteraceae bacterium]|jgi:ribose transport system permease protein|uniref:ABC transporter permease n=1 Tax=Biomaibacter acetigenes TaxID=2316383 RepID=A0A3G2R3K0_9FIRM|nr:ABC transporter permease [Biomaibacter acetigenes]AYO30094.1 ABC transporter permease [Biomaibacter acetigenes]MDK2879812.1 ribose transport system permease protein [Thermoanaerobacteraceae bacterium]MDN5301183.1 ribose transport system permease protein [Thermoanaerobacteraceae bacterium]MDN5313448.1 ribose transport system permease protein [Thermoanaerobacteraceae bacterium]